jgi:hypothetical protein
MRSPHFFPRAPASVTSIWESFMRSNALAEIAKLEVLPAKSETCHTSHLKSADDTKTVSILLVAGSSPLLQSHSGKNPVPCT